MNGVLLYFFKNDNHCPANVGFWWWAISAIPVRWFQCLVFLDKLDSNSLLKSQWNECIHGPCHHRKCAYARLASQILWRSCFFLTLFPCRRTQSWPIIKLISFLKDRSISKFHSVLHFRQTCTKFSVRETLNRNESAWKLSRCYLVIVSV